MISPERSQIMRSKTLRRVFLVSNFVLIVVSLWAVAAWALCPGSTCPNVGCDLDIEDCSILIGPEANCCCDNPTLPACCQCTCLRVTYVGSGCPSDCIIVRSCNPQYGKTCPNPP